MTMNKNLYLIAAFFNLFVGSLSLYSFFYNPGIVFFNFHGYGPYNPLAVNLATTSAGNILLFGAGYFLVYLNRLRYQGIIVLGILGKLGVIATIPYLYSKGQASGLALGLSCVDVVFTFLFFLDLKTVQSSH